MMKDDRADRAGTRVDWTEYKSVSVALVVSLAERLETDPTTMPPLYDAIDPDLLDTLVHGSRGFGRSTTNRVVFEYANHLVTVRGDGSLTIAPATTESA